MMPTVALSFYHEVSAKVVNQQRQQISNHGSFSVLAIWKAHIPAIWGWVHLANAPHCTSRNDSPVPST